MTKAKYFIALTLFFVLAVWRASATSHLCLLEGDVPQIAAGKRYIRKPLPPPTRPSQKEEKKLPPVEVEAGSRAQSAEPPSIQPAPDGKDPARRPTSMRKQTLQEAWDNAEDSPVSGKLCPTCEREVKVPPGQKGVQRDWDGDHQPPWSTREKEGKTRKEILDEYNKGVRLECPSCNRSRGAEPAK